MELWRCIDCSVSFFAPEHLAGSGEMYAQLGGLSQYYVARKWEHEAALNDLKGRQKILEVGCGSGGFMTLATEEAGLLIEGLEQNVEAINEVTRRGLCVREATAESAAKESPGVYDAVCSFQVLEHVSRPKEFLDACCTLLRPGGLLILAVPNQNSYVRHMVDNPLDMPPHHMTRWTQKPLRRLQAHYPLKLLRITCEPLTDGQVQLYADTYAGALQRHGLGFLVSPWVRRSAARFIWNARVRRFFKGQNIYVCYLRT